MKHTLCVPERTIGIDLGDRFTHGCVLDAAGQVQERFRVATRPDALIDRLAQGGPARVVLEVGTHSPWVSRGLDGAGHEVIVADARATRRHGRDKNDRLDAEQLAREGRLDPRLLCPIRHRGETAQKDRMLLQSRDTLVRVRVKLINAVRGLTKALGLRLPACSAAAFAKRVRQASGDAELFPGAALLVEQIEQLSQAIRQADRAVARMAQRYPEIERLTQVRGVGTLSALAYVLTVEDPHRFADSRTAGSYFGLRPRQYASGQSDPQLRITKAGDAFVRRLLVQCAHYILGPFGADCDLRRFGLRLKARGGRGAHRKAVIAVARKLAVLLHRLWVSDQVYQPLHRSESITPAA